MKGRLLSLPGQVLDFDHLPDGAELEPGRLVWVSALLKGEDSHAA